MRYRSKIRASIPHFLTLTSLFLGFSSILASIQAVNDLYISTSLPFEGVSTKKHLAFAGICIFFAAIFDFLDGFFARLLETDSGIGAGLDSLTDFVSFGIAPGVLFYTITMIAGHHIPDTGIEYRVIGLLPNYILQNLFFFKPLSFVFPVCAIIRLARYNVSSSKTYFSGIPSTYAGSVIALYLTFNFYITPSGRYVEVTDITVPNFFLNIVSGTEFLFSSYFFLMFFYLLLSFLMISTFRFYRIDFLIRRMNIPPFNPVFFVLLVISGLYFKYFFVVMSFLYLLGSFGIFFLEKITGSRLDDDYVNSKTNEAPNSNGQ